MNTDALALQNADALARREAGPVTPREVDTVARRDAEAPGREDALVQRDAHRNPGIQERDLQAQERFEDELIMHLERDQFVVETSRPVPRAVLSSRVTAGLWTLRVFVALVSLMVLYTFVEQLH